MNSDEKIILVTGGSGLLGKEIIKNINNNNGIAINLDTQCEDNFNKNSLYFDVTDNSSIESGITKIMSFYGKIDGLVNNAYPRNKNYGNKFLDINYNDFVENLGMNDSQLLKYYHFYCTIY